MIVAFMLGALIGLIFMALLSANGPEVMYIDGSRWRLPREERPEGDYLVMISGATVPTVLNWNGESWRDDMDIWYAVDKWAYLPK